MLIAIVRSNKVEPVPTMHWTLYRAMAQAPISLYGDGEIV